MISVCGVKGSPGASTLALLAAALWPAPAVLVEADPAGGEFALTLAGSQGQALPGKPSIAELALDSMQRAGSSERIWGSALDTGAGVAVVCAIPSAQPMSNLLREYGQPVAAMLAGEQDVIVDAGRLATDSAALPLLAASTVVVVVLADRHEALFRLADLLPGLVSMLRVEQDVRSVVAPVVVARPRRGPAAAGEIDELLAQRGIPVRPARWVACDVTGAQSVRGGVARAQRSVLVRTARTVVEGIAGEQRALTEQRNQRSQRAAEQPTGAPAQWLGTGHAPGVTRGG